MYEIILAGGWLMIPILACSIGVIAIVFERHWTLNQSRIAPSGLLQKTWDDYRGGRFTNEKLAEFVGRQDAEAVRAARDLLDRGEEVAEDLADL